MKKKIILALTACLFAAGTIINMHLAQNNHNHDVSLADIAVMAQADGENGPCDPGCKFHVDFHDGCEFTMQCLVTCPLYACQ